MNTTAETVNLIGDEGDSSVIRVSGCAGERGQGPFMYLHLEVQHGVTQRAEFETYSCPSCIRCGDWVTKWVVGRAPKFLLVLKPEDLERVVGGLPLGKQHCAELAVSALRAAVESVQQIPHQ